MTKRTLNKLWFIRGLMWPLKEGVIQNSNIVNRKAKLSFSQYFKVFDELVQWGFIEYEVSENYFWLTQKGVDYCHNMIRRHNDLWKKLIY